MIVTQFVKTNQGWDVYSEVTKVDVGASVVIRESFEKVGSIRKTKVPGDRSSLIFVIDTNFANWELGPVALSAIVSHILANKENK